MEYIWYWLDGSGEWIEYGKQHANYCAATVTSADLEAAFLADRKGSVLFQAGSQMYEINFQDMVQRNLYYQTRRKVCRRPKSVFVRNVDKIERSQLETAYPLHLFPPNWDQSALPDIGYKLVEISNATSEYEEIKDLFEKTMKGYRINQLQRIQNPSLWQVFQCKDIKEHLVALKQQFEDYFPVEDEPNNRKCNLFGIEIHELPSGLPNKAQERLWELSCGETLRQKEQMRKKNRGQDVDERLLFHGTSSSHIRAICEQNFDWRICGTHGTAYGKGSYFARDADYSHHYCQSDSSSKTMFVARVLVGDSVQGSNDYLRPPPKPNNPNRFYDSCVDCPMNPSIFVIFEKHQIYPAYVIDYAVGRSCVIL